MTLHTFDAPNLLIRTLSNYKLFCFRFSAKIRQEVTASLIIKSEIVVPLQACNDPLLNKKIN